MTTTYKLIPEINYWIKKLSLQTPINEKDFSIPTEVSDVWRDPNSVVDLLFNENFNPILPQSSSSVDDEFFGVSDRRYIYKYRSVDINNIPDKNITNRIKIYRSLCTVYAVNSLKFLDYFNTNDTSVNNENSLGVSLVNDFLRGIFFDSDSITEEERSPYITYKSDIFFSSNYPVWRNRGIDLDNYSDVIEEDEQINLDDPINIFGLTEEELDMLDLLFDFKTSIVVDLSLVNFQTLVSPLSKLIYVYIDALQNDSFTYYNDKTPFSNGTVMLHTLFEKYVLDIIYIYRKGEYRVNYRESDVINNELVEKNVDYFMALNKFRYTYDVTPEDIIDGYIILSTDIEGKFPWDKNDFIMFRNGRIIKNEEEYNVRINEDDPENPYVIINLLDNKFYSDDPLVFYWSYVDKQSSFSEDDLVEQTNNTDSDIHWL